MDAVVTFAGWLRSDDAGAVAVITAICCLLLFGVGALAVDIGTEYEVRRQSQSAADLAALAGALYLPRQPALACRAALQNLKDNTPSGQAPGDVDDPSACDINGNTADGQISITNGATVVTVSTPVKIVQFGLAGALGISHGATGARAAAAIRSVGSVLPYALAASGLGGSSIQCVKVGQPPKSCPGPSDGNFNYLIFPRSDNTVGSTWIARNTALGIEADALPAFFAAAKTYYANNSTADLQCDDPRLLDVSTKPDTVAASSGAVTLQPPYKSLTPGETCANTDTGNKTPDVTDGLITLTDNGSSCKGKLATGPSTKMAIDNCNIVDDTFGSYRTTPNVDGVTGANCDAAQQTESLSGSVLDDQRFGIVPEVTSVPTTGSSDLAIIGFLGVYIGTLYDNSAGNPMLDGATGKVGAFAACVFPLDSIAGSGGGSPLSGFLGSGPTVPVLIK